MSSVSNTCMTGAGWSRRDVLSAAALGALALHFPLRASGAKSRGPGISGPLADTSTKGAMVWGVADLGYIAEEYFLSGAANIYRPVSMADAPDVASRDNVKDLGAREFSRQLLEADKPFTTRLIVYRPTAREKFSGNVIVESLHPTGGGSSLAWNTLQSFFIANGDAYVGVQHPLTIAGLKAADEARYGVLAAADATQLWAMLAQAGAAIKMGGDASPLKGYGVRHLLLTGYSYTGVATATFANYHHQESKLPDGRNVFDAYLPMADAQYVRPLDVPVMRLNTQSDYNGFGGLNNRRDDDERYRHYEVAGASHVAIPPPADAATPPAPAKLATAPGQPHFSVEECRAGFPKGSRPNDFPLYLVQAAMFSNMYQWLNAGKPPPPSALIETHADGSTLLDKWGNAKGGVRLPQVSVPTATYGVGATAACLLFGYTDPFPAARSQMLYGNRDKYLAKVQESVNALLAERYVLPPGAERLLAIARADPGF